MGLRNAPGLCQSAMDKFFRCHAHAQPFIDDVTVFSETVRRHVDFDLPKFMAICSHYNLLLSPDKADILRRECRILGHNVSESALSISPEKIEKIKSLTFPEDKKDLISKLAFFQWFIRLAPRLAEFTAPLRELAKPSVRFVPTDEHRKAFNDAISHLLDENVASVRMPSPDIEDTLVIWTDASTHSLSALITQMLVPLDAEKTGDYTKRLHIVGCWSAVLKPQWANYPIWLLELMSLSETCHKFSWLVGSRAFWVVTDSKVVVQWASIDLVPRDIARKILALQAFDYKILFVESRLNPADAFSRIRPKNPPNTDYPRFLRARIYNSRGEKVDWTKLFSREKSEAAAKFFMQNRNQQMSSATDRNIADNEEEEEENPFFRPHHTIETQLDSNDPNILPSTMEEPVEEIFESVAALEIDDDDLAEGRMEKEEEGELDDRFLEGMPLPIYEADDLERIRYLQDDEVLRQCRDYIGDDVEIPDKLSVLQLPYEVQNFLRHRSLFRLSPQGIIFRLWLHPSGKVNRLIMVGKTQFMELLHEAHTFHDNRTNTAAHIGIRKTFQILSNKVYAFDMRRQIINFINECGTCALNQHHKTNPEKSGNQLRMEANACLTVDFLGPLHGIGRTSTGAPQYVFVAVDNHSRYLHTFVTKSTSDSDVFAALCHVRRSLSGFPKRVGADNALFQEKSKSTLFLKENGVKLMHGQAYVSRCQAVAERAISSLTRTLTKLNTDSPSTPFSTLVEEATLILNSTPHDGLPNGLSPKEVHFTNAPTSFLHLPTEKLTGSGKVVETIRAARAAGREVLAHNVMTAVRRKEKESATNYTKKLQVDDLVLKKRTSFPSGAPVKLCWKVIVDAFKIVARVATNAFKVKSLTTGEQFHFPGDLLIKIRMTEDSAVKLVKSMEDAVIRNRPKPDVETRARRLARARANDVNCANRQLFVEIKPKLPNAAFEEVCEFNPRDV